MSIADPTGSGGKILSAGQAMRWHHGSKLFDAYDADGNGMMELTEFLPLLRKIEPDLSFEDIKYSFEAAGGEGCSALDRNAFMNWMEIVFHEFTDDEFIEQMDVLVHTSGWLLDGLDECPVEKAEREAAEAKRHAEQEAAALKVAVEKLEAEQEEELRKCPNPLFNKIPYPPLDRFVAPMQAGMPAWWEFVETDGGYEANRKAAEAARKAEEAAKKQKLQGDAALR